MTAGARASSATNRTLPITGRGREMAVALGHKKNSMIKNSMCLVCGGKLDGDGEKER